MLNTRLTLLSQLRSIGTLVLIEHKNGKIASGSLNALSAAKSFNQPVTALIAGSGSSLDAAAKSTATCEGVENIIVASHDAYGHGLAEPTAQLLVETVKAGGFTQGTLSPV